MSGAPPLASIAVGVVLERSKSSSQWADFYWRPADVLAGAPETPPWTKLNDDGERGRDAQLTASRCRIGRPVTRFCGFMRISLSGVIARIR